MTMFELPVICASFQILDFFFLHVFVIKKGRDADYISYTRLETLKFWRILLAQVLLKKQ